VSRTGRVLALLAFAPPAIGWAAESPCPAHLFRIERSKNANIVVYDANRGPAGDLSASQPVVAYWLLNGEGGRREELNAVERDRAYGVEAKPGDTPGTYSLVFKADRKRPLAIRTIAGCPAATGPIGGKDGILRRIFVRSKEGSFPPGVEFVELFGEGFASGEALYEKFVPGK